MEIIAALTADMRREFDGDWGRIVHALRVFEYARQIAVDEGANERIVAAAAILHDIGIPTAERQHGSSAGRYQEKEGPPIAEAILRRHHIPEAEIGAVCQIIANHHSAKCPPSVEFDSVWDADWLVNIPDEHDEISPLARQKLITRVFRTTKGRALAERDVVDPALRFETVGKLQIDVLRKLAEEIWYQHFPGIISEHQIKYMLHWMYSPDTIADELRTGTIWQFVYVNGERVGYISIKPESERLYASKIYLNKRCQGHGIGQRLLHQIADIACAFELPKIYLFVNRKNEMAIKAYHKFGFEISGERVKQLEHGYVMDDFEMTYTLQTGAEH